MNYPCACYSCSYVMESIISACVAYAAYIVTLWNKKDHQIYCSAVMMVISVYSLFSTKLKRTYVNENLEVLTLSFKIIRMSLGGLILIKKLIRVGNLSEDLLLVIAVASSIVIAPYLVSFSDKKVLKHMYEQWSKNTLNTENIIDMMLFIHRTITHKGTNRKGQILYEGHFIIHTYNCNDPNCFISKLLKRANIDVSTIEFTKLATFINKNPKQLNKLVSSIYYRSAKL